MERLLIVALGGAFGSAARYLLSGWIARTTTLPAGTFAVNVIGSFLIAVITEVSMNTESIPPMMRLGLTVGVLGGFTTYSTFNYETLQLLRSGSTLLGAANIGLTGLGCLAAGILGLGAGRLLSGV